jgi:predicted ATPase
MLLGGLMKALFARGITLVATSNIPPDELYRNGLQRARFLPAIDAIKQHCDIMNVDAGIDYRLRTLTQAHLWLSPLNARRSSRWINCGWRWRERNASRRRRWRLTIDRCRHSASKTRRWRPRLPHCAWMRAASTTISRFRACSIP